MSPGMHYVHVLSWITCTSTQLIGTDLITEPTESWINLLIYPIIHCLCLQNNTKDHLYWSWGSRDVSTVYKNYPWNEDTSFNQDTMRGPSYIEKCTLEMRMLSLIRTPCVVLARSRSMQNYPWNEDTSLDTSSCSCEERQYQQNPP